MDEARKKLRELLGEISSAFDGVEQMAWSDASPREEREFFMDALSKVDEKAREAIGALDC